MAPLQTSCCPSAGPEPGPPVDLLDDVRALAASSGGLAAGSGVLVALSGGPDSTALLDLLARLRPERNLRLVAAHLDHGLRASSGADAARCADLCAQLEVQLRTERQDVAALAHATGLGVEAAGRHARYRWFEQVRSQLGLDLIVTGHHLDDHVETLLLWLLRGAGLDGLTGIAPRRGRVARPLRRFRKAQIHDYLEWRGLPSLHDPTNWDPRFARNRLRHELLPLLESLGGPGVVQRLDRFSRHAARDRDCLRGLASAALARPGVVNAEAGALRVDREAFRALPPALRYQALRLLLSRFAPASEGSKEGPQRWTEPTARRLMAFALHAPSGARTPLPGGGWLVAERDRWRLDGAQGPESCCVAGAGGPVLEAIALQAEVLPLDSAAVTLATDRTACFDADAVRPPLRVRRARAGDRMRPHGMSGRKRLVRLYQEHGVPGDLRGRMLVVEDRERIVWAVGVTTCDETRITPETRRILRLTLDHPAPAPVAQHDGCRAGKDPGTR